MLNIDEVNSLCAEIAQEESEKRIAEYADELDEEMNNEELIKQHEMLSRAADLENFSPFDTVNS